MRVRTPHGEGFINCCHGLDDWMGRFSNAPSDALVESGFPLYRAAVDVNRASLSSWFATLDEAVKAIETALERRTAFTEQIEVARRMLAAMESAITDDSGLELSIGVRSA